MKVIHVRIECSNEKRFTCKVTTDNLSREDANEYEQKVADTIEGLISSLMEELAKHLKTEVKTTKL